MERIARSGLHYPNKLARIYFQTIAEIMGKNGLGAVLKVAHVSTPADGYPPDNLELEFDFADYSAISAALEELYGERGGRTLALRAGRASFTQALRTVGPLAGTGEPAFKALPLQTKVKLGLPAMAKSIGLVSDQRSWVEEKLDAYHYHTAPCPICWGRKSAKPVCHAGAALLEEGLRWVSGGLEFNVREDRCIGRGDEACVFVVQKEPIA